MEPGHRPHTAAEGSRTARRVLLIGWDGVDHGRLRHFLQSGRLPHLKSLVEAGARLELTVPRPTAAPATWTSLATGAWPHEHGILHQFVPRTDGSGVEPIQRPKHCPPAIWSILTTAGQRTHVVGWPASYPAEAVAGVFVSDEFAMPAVRDLSNPTLGASVLPAAAEQVLRSRLVTPAQIEEVTLSQLLPSKAVAFAKQQQLDVICRAILAEAATLFRALRWCLAERPWDFAAGVFPGIRRCHELANWFQGVSPADSELRDRLLAGCYEHHDMLLGQLVQQVGGETYVVAVALAGPEYRAVETDDGVDSFPTMGLANRNIALAAIQGPDVRPTVGGARRNILDVTPTILALLGQPKGRDMPGQPWTDLFRTDLPLKVIDSWRAVVDDRPDTELQPADGIAADRPSKDVGGQSVSHLVELGYVDPRDAEARDTAENCTRATALNRAVSLLDAQMYSEAVSSLEHLVEQYPDWYPPHAALAELHFRKGDKRSARDELDWLLCRGIELPRLYYLAAAIEFADRRYERALAELNCARRGNFKLPGARTLEGQIYLRKRDFVAAETAFRSAVEFEGPSPQTHDGLAAVDVNFGRWEQAAVNALDAVAQDMQFARGHYHLGIALTQLAKPHEALRAFETWATIEPSRAAPYRWMAWVYQRLLADPNRAAASVARGREVVRQRRAASTPV